LHPERRFAGRLSEEYQLVKRAYPHYDEMHSRIGQVIAKYQPVSGRAEIDALDIGCGDGITADVILASRPNVALICIDNEPRMVESARKNLAEWTRARFVTILQADALGYLRETEDARFDVVASAFTLHNFSQAYRESTVREIFRVLKPGGVFINGDKYAPDGQEQFTALGVQLGRFFDAFVPLGQYELLKEWVLHNVADQAPDRVMKEKESLDAMRQVGFVNLEILYRDNMEAVLAGGKPTGMPVS
jgi:tRNA (cmo5U34)-methyltransferase